ncbi:hypothetical protein ASD74_21120 [Rhizobium sp. Root564]|nr:hypothetical protein ASD74_21120 [Rhizobium sp. Root564]
MPSASASRSDGTKKPLDVVAFPSGEHQIVGELDNRDKQFVFTPPSFIASSSKSCRRLSIAIWQNRNRLSEATGTVGGGMSLMQWN